MIVTLCNHCSKIIEADDAEALRVFVSTKRHKTDDDYKPLEGGNIHYCGECAEIYQKEWL
jgi:hypothetical protein